MKQLIRKCFVFATLIAYYLCGVALEQHFKAQKNDYTSALWAIQLPAKAQAYDCAQIIQLAADKHQLPPELITAVIHAESNFNPSARSPVGASGLMQINEVTRKHLKLNNVWDPKQNIAAGSRYLRELLNRFHGNTALAIAAYNAGPGAVSKYKGVPPYRETQNYVRKVMRLMKQDRGEGEAVAQM